MGHTRVDVKSLSVGNMLLEFPPHIARNRSFTDWKTGECCVTLYTGQQIINAKYITFDTVNSCTVSLKRLVPAVILHIDPVNQGSRITCLLASDGTVGWMWLDLT